MNLHQTQMRSLWANEGRPDILQEPPWELRLSFERDIQLPGEGVHKRINYILWADRTEEG